MNHPILFLKLQAAKLRCWLLHGRHHRYKPIYHSYWRFCAKCHLGVLIND